MGYRTKVSKQGGDSGIDIVAYNAKAYLEQHPIIRGLDGSEVVDLVLRYYDDLDDKYQDMISLKRVYIPVLSEDFSTLE